MKVNGPNGIEVVPIGSNSGSFTGSLFGTTSWAENAITASYVRLAQTASYVLNAVSSSYAQTASFAPNYLPLTGGTINGNVTVNGTASIAFLNVTYESASVIYSSGSNQFGDATDDIQTLIGTVIVSGSQQITGSLNAPNITGSLFGTASWAINALTASTVSPLGNAFVQGGNSFSTTALLGTNDNRDLQIETSGSVRMIVSSSGEVGIGITAPTAKLHINNTTPSASFLVEDDSNPDSTPFIIDASGSVGIGTTTPQTLLHLNATAIPSTNESILRLTTNDGGGAYLDLNNGSTINNVFVPRIQGRQVSTSTLPGLSIEGVIQDTNDLTSVSPVMQFRVSKTSGGSSLSALTAKPLFRFTNWDVDIISIDASGNVGIGTTVPTANLHVKDVIRLDPRINVPSIANEGDIYYDSTLKKLRVFDGIIWQNCW
jgi:hypothetical protein